MGTERYTLSLFFKFSALDVRIISGIYKGRRIVLPSTIHIRPTTDFAKESLFNIINNRKDFSELEVLDLFSGTGSIAYEFISRGVIDVVAVENHYKCVEFIKNNINILQIDNLKVVRMSAHEFINVCKRQFDIIFADPPYDMPHIPQFVENLRLKNLLKPNGIFILEHAATYNFSEIPGFIEKRSYGSVNFSFFSFI